MASVKKINVSSNKVSSEIDLFEDLNVPREFRQEIKEQVGDLLVDHILTSVAEAKTPIASGKYKSSLSPDYKKFKSSQGRGNTANLEFTGGMLGDLSFRTTGQGIEIGVFGKASAGKADGHNNFSGTSDLPPRQFLPKVGEFFGGNHIKTQVDEVIRSKIVENVGFTRLELSDIRTESGLKSFLTDKFPSMTFIQVTNAILAKPELVSLFEGINLLRFLRG